MTLSKTDSNSSLHGRISLFIATLAPMSIWLLADGRLARPWNVALWALCVAVFAASLPKRFAYWCAWAQVVFLPVTIGWIGAVAVSGSGPSIASTASLTAGSFGVALTAASMVLRMPAFVFVMLLSSFCCIWAVRATRKMPAHLPKWAVPVSLICLLSLPLTAMDAMGFHRLARLVSSEAKVSVPWLSHLELLKEELDLTLTRASMGDTYYEQVPRNVNSAPRLFDMQPGLALFIIGESLRADAAIQPQRGPWSQALMARFASGLGVRLPNVCSGSNSTFGALGRLMTAVDVADELGAVYKPTVLALARAAGAKTAYINNHQIWVVPEMGHDFMLKTSSMQQSAFDDAAVEALADFLKRTAAPSKAAMLHIFGQHFNYEDRYPQDMFSTEPEGLSNEALIELRYSRAAEEGARILVLAARVLDEQPEPAFLVFTSDHGENLPSDNSGKNLHAGAWVGRNDTTVPGLVLWNKAFAASGRAQKLEPLIRASGLIAHRDIANAWLELAGMSGALTVTQEPRTFGNSGLPSQTGRTIACSELPP